MLQDLDLLDEVEEVRAGELVTCRPIRLAGFGRRRVGEGGGGRQPAEAQVAFARRVADSKATSRSWVLLSA